MDGFNLTDYAKRRQPGAADAATAGSRRWRSPAHADEQALEPERGDHLGRVHATLRVNVDDGDAGGAARDADIRARTGIPGVKDGALVARAVLEPAAPPQRLLTALYAWEDVKPAFTQVEGGVEVH